MSDLNQDNLSLAAANNRHILDTSLGRLFPVNTDPKIQTVHATIDQTRRANGAAVSLTALINGMHDAPQEGQPQG